MKQKFNIITSTCVPLPLENVDTDQIIPARFLKRFFIRKINPCRHLIFTVIYLVIDRLVKHTQRIQPFQIRKMPGCLHLNPAERQCLQNCLCCFVYCHAILLSV